MVRIAQIAAAAALATAAGAPLRAQENAGLQPADYIEGRIGTMLAVEGLLGNLEAAAEDGTVDEIQAFVSLEAIAASLESFALLFPADTNLLGTGTEIEGVSTTAAATIWDDFPAFRARLAENAALARDIDTAAPAAGLVALRENCTACHDAYVFYDPFAAMGLSGN